MKHKISLSNISIRHALPDDYISVHAIYSQPRAYAGTLQLPYSSPERWKQRLEQSAENGASLVACVDNKIVGSIGVAVNTRMRRRHVGTIGMSVHDDWQGKGIGTALMDAAIELADNWYNIVRLELTVFVDNEAAIALYKRSGFEIEGTLKKYAFRGGKYVDAYSMSRISVSS